jgi:rod shape-determining protein MreC
MSHRPPLYALLAGALLTLLVLGLDLTNPDAAVSGGLRSVGAAVTGPLLTTVAQAFPEPPESASELTETSARLALTEDALRAATGSAELAMSPTLTALTDNGHGLVLARVVAVGTPGPTGPERLTIDVGTRDGIREDQSVVASAGLVGRTVRVGRSTSDVLILGAPDLVVGVRTEGTGLLGTAGPPDAGQPREPGQLTFTAIAFGEASSGERLLTLGSPDNVPFVAGIPIGEVAAVDPSSGRVGLTATVTPAVDIATLDVVAVVVPGPPAGEPG